MTTLEIKRLDSSSSPTVSPNLVEKRYSLQSPSKTLSNNNNNNSNNNSNKSPKHILVSSSTQSTDSQAKEIPISIIKSPSYNNQLTLNNSLNNNNTNTVSMQLSPAPSISLNDNKVITNSSSPNHQAISNRTSSTSTMNTSSMMKNSQSEYGNGDLSVDLEGGAGDIGTMHEVGLVPNTDTIKFNKYGFVQPANNTIVTLETNPNSNSSSPKSKNRQTILNNSTNTNTLSNKKLTIVNNNNSAQKSDDERESKEQELVTVTNLKDYLQNTNVEQFSEEIPIKVIHLRELKWVEMLRNFDEWMDKRFKKIKSRCRKGIPQSMRSKAWMHLTGAIVRKSEKPNYYNECLQNPEKHDINKYIDDIKKDLHRQFPSHEIFMKREGRQMLFNVLKAYAVHNPQVGYCQAQGPIAALLLMHMPEEDAFWMLVQISDQYLKGYFKPGLEKVQIDGQTLFYLYKRENQVAYKLLLSQSIDPVLYMTEWFMCVFARTLPWCTVLRVWDMFFCEGVKVLYRVGLYLMLSAFNDKNKFQRCQQQGMYETLNLLKNLPIECLSEANLIRESSLIKISESDFKKAFEKSTFEFNKQASEMQMRAKQPPPPSSYKNTKR